MLKFLIDNNIPSPVWNFLKNEGFEIVLIKDLNPQMSDMDLIEYAKENKLCILSNDKDFMYLNLDKFKLNCIIFNLIDQNPNIKIKLLKDFLTRIKKEKYFGLIVLKN